MSSIETQPQISQSGTVVMREYATLAWRRKWAITGAIVIAMAAAWSYCLLAPKLYRSETLILVEDQKIPEAYVQGVVEANLEQRIFVIQRQVTSHGLLREAVKEFNLFPKIKEVLA
jgi:succinoglycan biosynthesis transport protein ExoP